jgi:oligoendopeptidase F
MSLSLRWDLSNVFPGLESGEFDTANSRIKDQINDLVHLLTEKVEQLSSDSPDEQLSEVVGEAIDRFNKIYEDTGTLRAYIQSFTATDSHNVTAMKKMSEFQLLAVQVQTLSNRFQAWVGKIAPRLDGIIKTNPTAAAHAFSLVETAEQSKYMMSAAEEALAAELSVSGASAWAKLQITVTSQLTADFELDGKRQKLPMPALINLHSHPDESVRHRAYETELAAWKTVEEPLAACMNGIKGAVNTLNKHRGRSDALHPAIDKARIDRATLETMLAAMEASFPVFRRYFKAKAKRLGKEKLAWWDFFAPSGKLGARFSFEDSRDFIAANFAPFSPELADFTRQAFEHAWIDAEQREGKRGGAFCMGVPGVKESRILCNFDGTLDSVSTIAHELGHAFHNYCAFQAGKTEIQQDTPMTMAETASIMCETIVMEAALAQAKDPAEQLAIIETRLIGDGQVIMDIYSRYLFEKEVFERREKSDLSSRELCEIMEVSQKRVFGEALDENALHKYMWTWKPHYYYPGLAFYNFPYAFGLLFATGLYAIYQQRGAEFVPDFKHLLASTGEATAADLAARFGIDIRSRKFWEDSLGVIARRIDQYCKL